MEKAQTVLFIVQISKKLSYTCLIGLDMADIQGLKSPLDRLESSAPLSLFQGCMTQLVGCLYLFYILFDCPPRR